MILCIALCLGDLPYTPVPSQIFKRLPGNRKKLTFYEPAKLLTEQVIHLSVIKSYQLEFHPYSLTCLEIILARQLFLI